MKYIKSFEKHRKKETINEEFIGGLLKKLKNKLSLSFSKSFGSANEVTKLMEEYEKKVFDLSQIKIKILSDYAKYIKENEEVDPKKTAELNKKYEAADNNFKQQVDLEKKKFDIRFNSIIADEKNPKIKEFIQLQKLEMQQRLLSAELNSVMDTLSEEEIKAISTTDANFNKIIDSIQSKMKKSEEQIQTVSNSLKDNTEKKDESSYVSIEEKDMEKVKSDKGFEESAFVKGEVKFKDGDKVTYWSTGMVDGKEVGKAKENKGIYISEDLEDKEKIKIKVLDDSGNVKKDEEGKDVEVSIYKKRIISKGEKSETKPEDKKEQNTEL